MNVQSTVMELNVEINSRSIFAIGTNEVCCRSDVLLVAKFRLDKVASNVCFAMTLSMNLALLQAVATEGTTPALEATITQSKFLETL